MIDDNSNNPLVSVCVITYNSAKTITETLDSIASQTYKNIELIVSDDGSNDKTIEETNKWIQKNRDRFVRTEIITVEKNTGVTSNYIRAEESCKGDWIKNIDGDDLLIPSAIEDFIKLSVKKPDVDIFYSRIKPFGISEKSSLEYVKRYDFSFIDASPEVQYEMAKETCIVPPMAAFVNLKRAKEVGLKYDMRIPMLEDRPYILNAIRLGLKFGLLDEEALLYRVRPDSLSNSSLYSPVFYKSQFLCYLYYSFEYDYQRDKEKAIEGLIKREMSLYTNYYNGRKFLFNFKNSAIGRFLYPIYRLLKK